MTFNLYYTIILVWSPSSSNQITFVIFTLFFCRLNIIFPFPLFPRLPASKLLSLSHIMKKPAFAICKQHRFDQKGKQKILGRATSRCRSQPLTPRGREKVTHINVCIANKQMHDKHKDQLPLPQARWSKCYKSKRNTQTKSRARPNMKRLVV